MWSAQLCDIMPTISEDSGSQRGSVTGFGGAEEANFEQLMVQMLDERDKLMESLGEVREQLNEARGKMEELERERNALQEQLVGRIGGNLPPDFSVVTQELCQLRETLREKEEEITELKAERSNTRLLLEHLECLVSRHERSLRMTVVKRQAQSQSGVSSEVEVLKALKSLFEHHKALDEKVRERLRVALEKVSKLEDDIKHKDTELSKLRAIIAGDDSDRKVEGAEDPQVCSSLSNGFVAESGSRAGEGDGKESDALQDLKRALERKTNELTVCQRNMSETLAQVTELEQKLSAKERETRHLEESRAKAEGDAAEREAARREMEERLIAVEKRLSGAQHEAVSLREMNSKLEEESQNRLSQLELLEERLKTMEEKLEISEQKVTDLTRTESESQEEIRKRMESLAKEHNSSSSDHIRSLEAQLEEKGAELARISQRLRMAEEHNQRLSSTVDNLISESDERLRGHHQERLHQLQEKNQVQQEVERIRKLYEESMNEKSMLMEEIGKMRQETDNLKRRIIAGELTARTGAPSRSIGTGSLPRSGVGKDWDLHHPEAQVLAHVQSNFDLGETAPHPGGEDDTDSVFSALDLISPTGAGGTGGQTDAHTLARMLQEQLDAINTEIRMIQEEKASAEVRAEELESRLGGGGPLEPMSLPPSARAPFSGMLPPMDRPPSPLTFSGRSTPQRGLGPESFKYHTLPTPVSAGMGGPQTHFFPQSAQGGAMEYPGPNTRIPSNMLDHYGTHEPYEQSSPRGTLPRAAAQPGSHRPPLNQFPSSASQEELRRSHGFLAQPYQHTGSLQRDTSSRPMAQGSVGGQPGYPGSYQLGLKKGKGLKSSLGRLFWPAGGKRGDKAGRAPGDSGYSMSSSDYLSDGEMSGTESSPNASSGNLVGVGPLAPGGGFKGDFDRRRKKKHELLAEAMKAGEIIQPF
ncbi:unnamed protein product [Cyprideis torosa]|uniref:Liprin-alpha CC2 domain-containing protein n=1 Tax=Cyprideis torosa TaxID=163714 RepID=A0A7R8W8P6_9CRUS|nr:unnamed protein product [Cyprideis torosa]CAG0884524.1 unnamed protein product [Cyprideis torosa]